MASLSEAPGALLIRAYGAKEVYAPESGPVDVREVQLRVRHLPQKEVGHPDLPRRAEDEIGIGKAGGGYVAGNEALVDVVDIDRTVDGIADYGPHGLRDVLPTSVGYGHVQDMVSVPFGPGVGVLHGLEHIVRQRVLLAYYADGHLLLVHLLIVGELVQGLLEEIHEIVDLFGIAAEVLHGERVHGEHLHPETEAPVKDLVELLAPQPVALHRGASEHLLGVAPVAVHDYGDVLRHPAFADLVLELGFVRRIDGVYEDALEILHLTRNPLGCRRTSLRDRSTLSPRRRR